MPSILDNLTNAPGAVANAASAPAPDAPNATPGAQVDAGQVPPAADPSAVVQAFPFLSEIQSGKLPGVVVPPGWGNPSTKVISPQVLGSLGLIFYHPVNPSSGQLAIFNPKTVKKAEIQKLDKEGSLLSKFPSMESFVPSISSNPPDAGAPAPAAAPQAPGPSEGKVPVVPVATAAPSAPNPALARAQAANVAPNQAPSARQVPGGGTILNSLLKRAV